MFVCFAPKQNPRIAIACFVQNAGFGSTWAGPISRILIEKYLNDTLQTRSVADVERISNTNLIPAYFKRLQYTTDSTRAYKWLEQYKDSSLLKRFLKRSVVSNQVPEKSPFHPEKEDRKKSTAFVLQTEKKTTQNNTKKTT